MTSVATYFDLKTEEVELGGSKGTRTVRELSLYLGALLGSLSKVIYDLFTSSGDVLDTRQLVIAAIGSAVSFPALYRNANLNRGPLSPVKFFVAFQHGFFWSLVIAGIESQFSAPGGT